MASEDLYRQIGKKIRLFRIAKKISMTKLAKSINKSKSSLCKYENGQTGIDIATLYEIAAELNVSIEQLLPTVPIPAKNQNTGRVGKMFANIDTLFIYRRGRFTIFPSVLKLAPKNSFEYSVILFYDVKDYDALETCEHLYYGNMKCMDSIISLELYNQSNLIELMIVNFINTMVKRDVYVGLASGLANYPVYPVATKMLLSKYRLKLDDALMEALTTTKEENKYLRRENRLYVLGSDILSALSVECQQQGDSAE